MRIAILTNTFPPDGRGGAERIAWIQAEYLVRAGHEVKVWKPIGPEEPKTNGYEVVEFASGFYSLGNHGPLYRLFFHLFDLHGARKLAREIIEWKPNALITHNITGCGIKTGHLIQSAGIKWVHILHDIQLFEHTGQIRADKPAALYAPLFRAVWGFLCRGRFGTPDVMASPTKWLIDIHRAYGFAAKHDIVLPNPLDDEAIRQSEIERPYLSPGSLLYAGRLSEEKGFGVFLHAIRHLDPNVAVSGIVVAGDGPMIGAAHLLGDERLECVGGETVRDSSQRFIAIKNAALLVAPSLLQENQQTILLEAMAAGTPVIATDTGGTHETLEGTGCPVLSVNQDLGVAIAKEIKRILSDAAEWKRLSDAMRLQAKRHEVGEYMKKLVEVCGK